MTALGFSAQTLGYDPLGLRVRRTVTGSGGANQRFHLEGEHLEAIYTAAGVLRAKFLRGSVIDEVVNGYYYVGPTFKPTNYTYHHDPLQSVVGISAPTGSLTETLRYGPFGNLLASSGTSSSTLRYTGREHDSLSGLYYYRARYYDPEIGRFLSEDPSGFGGGDVNLYAYVRNNPLIASDPMGEELVGLSVGVNIPLPVSLPFIGTSVTGSVTFAAGRDPSVNNGAWQYDAVATGELAGGPGDPFPSAFVRGVASLNPSVVPQDLTGLAPSVTVDALLLTGSVTFPRAFSEGDVSTRIYELGFTTPSVDLDASLGYGRSVPELIRSMFGATPASNIGSLPSQQMNTPTFVANSTK